MSNICVITTGAGKNMRQDFDVIVKCLNHCLRKQFITWALICYKLHYPSYDIEFYADIAFTEAVLTFKHKAIAGEIYTGDATVKTVFFGFCKFALMARLKTANREEKRKEQYTKILSDNTFQLDGQSNDKENMYALLQKAMQQLNEEERQIITWRHLEEKRNDEIAQRLAITTASATNKIYRCMEKLRSLVQKISKP